MSPHKGLGLVRTACGIKPNCMWASRLHTINKKKSAKNNKIKRNPQSFLRLHTINIKKIRRRQPCPIYSSRLAASSPPPPIPSCCNCKRARRGIGGDGREHARARPAPCLHLVADQLRVGWSTLQILRLEHHLRRNKPTGCLAAGMLYPIQSATTSLYKFFYFLESTIMSDDVVASFFFPREFWSMASFRVRRSKARLTRTWSSMSTTIYLIRFCFHGMVTWSDQSLHILMYISWFVCCQIRWVSKMSTS
jgi:hypothetical protein